MGFEDIPASLDKLIAAGIPIFKLQEAAALWIAELSADMVLDLRVFTDTIYLSQTTERVDGAIRAKYLNLGEALDAYEADPGPRELRMHFHVPVFLEELGHSRPLVSVWSRRFPNIVRRRCRITWNRDVHVGCVAFAPQDRRHHRVRDQRVGVRSRRGSAWCSCPDRLEHHIDIGLITKAREIRPWLDVCRARLLSSPAGRAAWAGRL